MCVCLAMAMITLPTTSSAASNRSHGGSGSDQRRWPLNMVACFFFTNVEVAGLRISSMGDMEKSRNY